MPIITTPELAQAVNISKMPGLARVLMEIFKLNEINDVFDKVQDYEGLDFIDKLLDTIGVKIEIDPKDLKKIPKNGAFIAVANHPYGGIEGIIMLKLICSVRPDFKMMVNFILEKIPNLQPYFIAVNPFEDLKEKSSLGGIKKILAALDDKTPIGIFPAGEVSTYNLQEKRVVDKVWHPVVGKIIKKSGAPVLPVFFKGNNGLLFQVMSLLHPKLRTAKLPSEFLNKGGRVIKVRIGQAIQQEELEHFPNSKMALNYIRTRMYALEMGCENKLGLWERAKQFTLPKSTNPVIGAIPETDLEAELETLSEYLVSSEGAYEVYNCPSYAIPKILLEIGRLREVTFREVGEGTGKAVDLDQYDVYYHHLFVWDKAKRCLVGAYRIGLGEQILETRGMAAFYISELFKVEKGFSKVLESGLELGRSWVRKDYQGKPLPLFLLWKGLILLTLNNPKIKYFFGPVSISNDYSTFSKALIVEFIKKNYYDHELSQYIIPRKDFKVKKLNKEDLSVLSAFGNNVKVLDTIIADVDKQQTKIPVLLRQYIAMNGRIAAFNIDPAFADCLDGLLVLNVEDLPASLIDKVKGSI